MSDDPAQTAKRKKPKALTPLSVESLRARGFQVDKVEQRIPHCFVTRDCFNVFDLLACKPGYGIAGVQVTGGQGGNAAARRTKILAEPRARVWVESGGRILLHAWAKRNDRQRGRRKLWTCVEEELRLEDFATPVAEPAASTT